MYKNKSVKCGGLVVYNVGKNPPKEILYDITEYVIFVRHQNSSDNRYKYFVI